MRSTVLMCHNCQSTDVIPFYNSGHDEVYMSCCHCYTRGEWGEFITDCDIEKTEESIVIEVK